MGIQTARGGLTLLTLQVAQLRAFGQEHANAVILLRTTTPTTLLPKLLLFYYLKKLFLTTLPVSSSRECQNACVLTYIYIYSLLLLLYYQDNNYNILQADQFSPPLSESNAHVKSKKEIRL